MTTTAFAIDRFSETTLSDLMPGLGETGQSLRQSQRQ